jgi:FtsH-binding integral membrane protein
MDAVVIGVIISLAGTVIVIGYLAYRFFKIIGGKDEPE